MSVNTTSGDEDKATNPQSVFYKDLTISEAIFIENSEEIPKAISREIKTMAISLPNFPPFDVHLDGNAGPRWKKWLARFERLTIAMGITEDKQKRALLLHYGGPEVDETFDTLQDVGEDKD